MHVTHESITINRPRQEVWDFVTVTQNQVLWQSNLIDYESARDGEPRVGDLERGIVKAAGRKVEWTAEIIQADAGKAIAMKSIEAPFPFMWRMELEDDDGGTKVTIHAETESLGGFFGKLGDPIVNKMYARDTRANLENLKELLEA
jgi:uncharacterized membrane protein